ncbi:unnamed protein product [Dovyalis caffra]|uniref:Uncharacterized protein n=1 Tax=Dovyalis caffra TaxID=77055 RepID=A0AAV1SKF8_9ROSI|nr:unnamed protein product [Dovyalis caffra]
MLDERLKAQHTDCRHLDVKSTTYHGHSSLRLSYIEGGRHYLFTHGILNEDSVTRPSSNDFTSGCFSVKEANALSQYCFQVLSSNADGPAGIYSIIVSNEKLKNIGGLNSRDMELQKVAPPNYLH